MQGLSRGLWERQLLHWHLVPNQGPNPGLLHRELRVSHATTRKARSQGVLGRSLQKEALGSLVVTVPSFQLPGAQGSTLTYLLSL